MAYVEGYNRTMQLAGLEKLGFRQRIGAGAQRLGDSFKSLTRAPQEVQAFTGSMSQAAKHRRGGAELAREAMSEQIPAAQRALNTQAGRLTGQANATTQAARSRAKSYAREVAPAAGVVGAGAGAAGLGIHQMRKEPEPEPSFLDRFRSR